MYSASFTAMATSTHDEQGRLQISNFTLTAMSESEIATGVPALAMLQQTGILPTPRPGIKILDNACGAGIVAKRLFANISSPSNGDFELVCGEVDMTMVNMTSDLIRSKQWKNVSVDRIDAHDTRLPDNAFDYVLMNFGPQLMRDAVAMLKETYRLTKSQGTIGFTCWSKAGWLPSVVEVFPDFEPPGLLQNSPWKSADSIEGILTEIGFEDIEVKEHDFITRPKSVENFLELMTLLMPPLMSGESKLKYEKHMRDKMEKGQVEMSWQALIVSAKKP